MGYQTQEASQYGSEWTSTARSARRRDNWTCQRCGHKSGPHAGDEGRMLDVHHLVWKARGGSDDDENLVTLCRPCHGVMHPKNSSFDSHRHRASMYPAPGADQRVAFVNAGAEGLDPEEFLASYDGNACQRCGTVPNDDDALLVYPDYRYAEQSGSPATGKCFALCEPCAGLVLSADNTEMRLNDLRTVENDPVESTVTQRADEAPIAPTGVSDRLSVTRDPVNRKEWVLYRSPLRGLYGLWRRYATFLLFVAFGYFFTTHSPVIAEQMNAYLPVPIPGMQWGTFGASWVGLIGAGACAYTARYGVTILTRQFWSVFDTKLEPHHFRRPVWPQFRSGLKRVLWWGVIPFVGFVGFALWYYRYIA